MHWCLESLQTLSAVVLSQFINSGESDESRNRMWGLDINGALNPVQWQDCILVMSNLQVLLYNSVSLLENIDIIMTKLLTQSYIKLM